MNTNVKKIIISLFLLTSFFGCGGSFTEMKEAQEEKNAKNYYFAFRDSHLLSNNPYLVAYVSHHGALIEHYANEKRDIGYQFEVVDWEEMNAINVGSGLTFMFSGMLRWAETTDEVVMIMGHEAAHSADRHMLDAIGDQIAVTILQLGLILSSDMSDEDQSLINFVDLLTTLRSLHYSRKHEAMADHFGARFVWSAGYNPHYSSVFFNRIQQLRPNGEPSDIDIAFSTHPSDATRIASIEQQYLDQILSKEESIQEMSSKLLNRGFAREAIAIAYHTKVLDEGFFYNKTIEESLKNEDPPFLNLEGFKEPVPKYKTCININTADEEELQALKDITPGVAALIIGHRNKNGEFSSVQSLENIEGLSRVVYMKIKNHLTVNEICENLPSRPKEDYEIINEYEAVLWGTLISAKRAFENGLINETFLEEDFFCLLEHIDYFQFNQSLFSELVNKHATSSPETVNEESLENLYDCSIPMLLNFSQTTLEEIQKEGTGSHLKILSSFFGSESQVNINGSISEIWGTINNGEWGRGSSWIVLHLINGDLYRVLFGPLQRYDKEAFFTLGK